MKKIGFNKITKISDLIKYLDSNERLANSDAVYHYTTISSAVSIIKNKCWHLGSPQNMNDKLEYDNGNRERWKNLFFSSFMCDDKESIGMWSMYSQPWKDGVKITIPKNQLKKWIKEIKKNQEITIVESDNKKQEGDVIKIDNTSSKLWLSSVAYYSDTNRSVGARGKLKWSTQSNYHFPEVLNNFELTGYIKDEAWSYEKEIRIKAELDNKNGDIKKISIPIPDYVIENMTITSSPLFNGILENRLNSEIFRQITKDRSKFADKLYINSRCSKCSLPNEVICDFHNCK